MATGKNSSELDAVLSGFSVSATSIALSDCKDKHKDKDKPLYNILKVIVHKNVLPKLLSMKISGINLRGSLGEFDAVFMKIPTNQRYSMSNNNLTQCVFFCKCEVVYEALGRLLEFIFQANGMPHIT
jgi:hypothetical protein